MLRLQFFLTNLERKEVKVPCQLSPCTSEPFPFCSCQVAQHTGHIQNSCTPEMTHSISRNCDFRGLREAVHCVLGRQICYCLVCHMKLVFLPQMHKRAVWDGHRVSVDRAIFHPLHLPRCNVNPCFFLFLPPLPRPPSFSYIMNNASELQTHCRQASSPLLSTPKVLLGPSTTFLTMCFYFSQATS